jgi:hypothetical protein
LWRARRTKADGLAPEAILKSRWFLQRHILSAVSADVGPFPMAALTGFIALILLALAAISRHPRGDWAGGQG